jgi:hypothetical protein
MTTEIGCALNLNVEPFDGPVAIGEVKLTEGAPGDFLHAAGSASARTASIEP